MELGSWGVGEEWGSVGLGEREGGRVEGVGGRVESFSMAGGLGIRLFGWLVGRSGWLVDPSAALSRGAGPSRLKNRGGEKFSPLCLWFLMLPPGA